ncbi:EEF1A lysine methyltransferase 4 [Glycine max]|nr:EEF1A lysine methyltransferase 4 [Glycine max]
MTTSTQAYGEPWYWDNRYSNEPGPFDWYQKYLTLAPIINLYVPPSHPVLVVGCGNSGTFFFTPFIPIFFFFLFLFSFSEGMVVDGGYTDVVNIDISSVVIEAMKTKHQDCPQLKFMKMDVRDMSDFQSGSFGAVIDKGTLDSILVSVAMVMLIEMLLMTHYRVLKDKGVYVLVTYGAPLYRLRLLQESCSWTIKLHVIEKLASEEKSDNPFWELTKPVPLNDDGSSVEEALGQNPDVHYIYICTKVITFMALKLVTCCMPLVNSTCHIPLF